MAFSVYKITCDLTGKSYIGVTVQESERRFARHKRLARLGYQGMPIYDAIRAFGEDEFAIAVIYEAASKEEMFIVERALIAAHGTMVPRGYNLARGGLGGSGIVSDAGRLARSEKMKAHWADPEFRARVSAAIKTANTPEVIAKRGAAVKISRNTEESKEKTRQQIRRRIAETGAQRSFTPESSEKFRASMRKHWTGDDHRKLMSEAGKKGARVRWGATT